MAQPPLQASGPPKEGRQQPHPPSEPLADQGPEDNTAPAATTTGSEAAGPAAVTTNANAAPAATPVLPVTLNGSAEGAAAAAAAAAAGPGTPAAVDAGAAQNPVAPTPTSSLLPPPSTDDAAVSTNGVEHNHTRHPTDASASYSVPVFREGSTDAAPSSTLDPTLYQQQQQQSPATEAATNGYDQNHAAITNGGHLSSASSPSMSNPHQPHGLPRQNSGYSNPTSYSPPIMNPAQFGYGPPQPGQPGGDLYRTSPAPGVNPAMSLPSMRSIDPLQQQQAQQGIPVPIPPTIGSTGGPMGYYPMPGYGMHHDMRFAMPPPFGHDPRVTLSGGRHKKEIKRRTKTGCLTCRKRRIKCDETHPTCNNCKKSKRDCAGYDPIFKQQQGPLPTIQPALGSTQQQPPTPTTLAAAPTVPSSAPPPNPYAHHQAPVLASSYHTSSTPQGQLSYDPALSSAPPTAKQEGFEYPPAIDPALEGTARLPLHDPLRPLDYGQPKGGAPSTVLQSQESPLTYSSAPAKDMKVDELIALGGPAPQPPATPPTREKLDEITNIYYDIYMTGLKEFFETTWFNFTPQGPNPISILHNNKTLMDLLTSFLDSLASIKSNDPSEMVMTGHLETRIVWALATLVYTIPAAINPPKDEPLPTNDATETRNRVAVFETLLSGGLLVRNPCMPPPKTGDPLRIREYEFWHWLGEYLRLQDTPQSNLAPQREQALARLRNLLDGRENRDILYSMVILRELSPQFPPGYEATLPKHLDETDARSKLAVAAQFIRTEALVSGGTTNVVRRFAELAAKAFISPGANARRA